MPETNHGLRGRSCRPRAPAPGDGRFLSAKGALRDPIPPPRGAFRRGLVRLRHAPPWPSRPRPRAASTTSSSSGPSSSITTAHVPLAEIRDRLRGRDAWRAFTAGFAPGQLQASIDPRSGAATSIVGVFPVPGGRSAGAAAVERLRARLRVRAPRGARHRPRASSATARATQVNADLWQVSTPAGLRRRARAPRAAGGARSATATWSSSAPRPGATCAASAPAPRLSAREALDAGFAYAGGRARRRRDRAAAPPSRSCPWRRPSTRRARRFAGPVGAGYGHRLVWTFVFQRAARGRALGGAGRRAQRRGARLPGRQPLRRGARSPAASTRSPAPRSAPTPTTCGTMQLDLPDALRQHRPRRAQQLHEQRRHLRLHQRHRHHHPDRPLRPHRRHLRRRSAPARATGNIALGGANGQHDCTTRAAAAPATPPPRAPASTSSTSWPSRPAAGCPATPGCRPSSPPT